MITTTHVLLERTSRTTAILTCTVEVDNDIDELGEYRPAGRWSAQYEISPAPTGARFFARQSREVVSPVGSAKPRFADLPCWDDAAIIVARWIELDGWTQDRGQRVYRALKGGRVKNLLDQTLTPQTVTTRFDR